MNEGLFETVLKRLYKMRDGLDLCTDYLQQGLVGLDAFCGSLKEGEDIHGSGFRFPRLCCVLLCMKNNRK